MRDERGTQHATLGCGTLILIALIVMFFSRSGTADLDLILARRLDKRVEDSFYLEEDKS